MIQKEELQAVYFGFYDQLNEPERSEAKENWDGEYTDIRIPETLLDAVTTGFDWDKTNESFDYWDDLYSLITTGRYCFKPNPYPVADLTLTINSLTDKVIDWAFDKGIFEKATRFKQAQKTLEECGELLHAIGANDQNEIKDAIGDIMVTIIIQAHMNNLSLEECLESAYNVISKRTGKMINGTFVKDSDL